MTQKTQVRNLIKKDGYQSMNKRGIKKWWEKKVFQLDVKEVMSKISIKEKVHQLQVSKIFQENLREEENDIFFSHFMFKKVNYKYYKII